jgi:endonuclease G
MVELENKYTTTYWTFQIFITMRVTFLSFFIVLTSFLYGQDNLPRLINFDDQIIKHEAYTLSYNESHEQPNWVMYMVTKTELETKVAKRKNNFKEDTSIVTGSAQLVDYKGSGYDRGHLAPAATFVDNQKEMDESFYMSNISPQEPGFNRGVWKRLEEYERKVAMEKDTVYVICGGILTDDLKTIGPNKVSVPVLYFKIIYTEGWMMCFILKNEKSSEPLYMFKQSLETVQKMTKIDFRPTLIDIY